MLSARDPGAKPDSINCDYLYGGFLKEEDVEEFRKMLQKTRAIVSGSVLVARISQHPFEPRDLDLFVKDKGTLEVGDFLGRRGFKFTPLSERQVGTRRESKQQPTGFAEAVDTEFAEWNPNTGNVADRYKCCHLAGVFNFTNEEGKTIQVIATRCTPVEAILRFHSTAVMNFATANEVTCLFPTLTFIEKKNLVVRDANSSAVSDCIRKYERRGWTTITQLSAFEALASNSDTRAFGRKVGDCRTWKIDITPRTNGEGEEPYTQEHSWTLAFPTKDETRLRYKTVHAPEGQEREML
ncbi:hypothetical protein VNI00_003661 [Paramarasmius palmivorus]|uniref:Uncharacterized protein n=1 Tax=Paramarasmius palmivorus TaxID=297713 RepID=A0AAW0DSA2_9AGAR